MSAIVGCTCCKPGCRLQCVGHAARWCKPLYYAWDGVGLAGRTYVAPDIAHPVPDMYRLASHYPDVGIEWVRGWPKYHGTSSFLGYSGAAGYYENGANNAVVVCSMGGSSGIAARREGPPVEGDLDFGRTYHAFGLRCDGEYAGPGFEGGLAPPWAWGGGSYEWLIRFLPDGSIDAIVLGYVNSCSDQCIFRLYSAYNIFFYGNVTPPEGWIDEVTGEVTEPLILPNQIGGVGGAFDMADAGYFPTRVYPPTWDEPELIGQPWPAANSRIIGGCGGSLTIYPDDLTFPADWRENWRNYLGSSPGCGSMEPLPCPPEPFPPPPEPEGGGGFPPPPPPPPPQDPTGKRRYQQCFRCGTNAPTSYYIDADQNGGGIFKQGGQCLYTGGGVIERKRPPGSLVNPSKFYDSCEACEDDGHKCYELWESQYGCETDWSAPTFVGFQCSAAGGGYDWQYHGCGTESVVYRKKLETTETCGDSSDCPESPGSTPPPPSGEPPEVDECCGCVCGDCTFPASGSTIDYDILSIRCYGQPCGTPYSYADGERITGTLTQVACNVWEGTLSSTGGRDTAYNPDPPHHVACSEEALTQEITSPYETDCRLTYECGNNRWVLSAVGGGVITIYEEPDFTPSCSGASGNSVCNLEESFIEKQVGGFTIQ